MEQIRIHRICRFLAVATAMVVATAVPAPAGEPPATVDSLTLVEVVRDVLRNNDRLAAARFMEEAAEHRAGASGGWDDPMLMLGVQNVPTNFDFTADPMTMKMIGLSQSIPWSGYRGLEKQAARSDADASVEERRSTQVDLVAAAEAAFYDAYFVQLTVADLQSQHGILQEVLNSATARLRTNQAGQEEVLAAQAEVWRLESMIRSAEQEYAAAINRLSSLRGADVTPSRPLASPGEPVVPSSPDSWIAQAEQNYPPLRRLNEQAKSYEFSARASRRMQWPMLSVEAAYGLRSGTMVGADGMEEERDNMLSFQANISVPIFSGGRQRAMARSMDAMQSGAEADAEQMRRDIRAELNTLFTRARRLSQSLYAYRRQIVPATEDAFRAALNSYTSNRSDYTAISNYSLALYRDRITANQLANELARTMAEVGRYTAGTAAVQE